MSIQRRSSAISVVQRTLMRAKPPGPPAAAACWAWIVVTVAATLALIILVTPLLGSAEDTWLAQSHRSKVDLATLKLSGETYGAGISARKSVRVVDRPSMQDRHLTPRRLHLRNAIPP